MSSPRSYRNQNAHSRIVEYRRNRLRFTIKVAVCTIICLAISLAHWLPFLLLPEHHHIWKEYFYVCMIFIFLALILVTTLVFWQRLRMMVPFNIILYLLIIEFVTLGLLVVMVNSTPEIFGISFGIDVVIIGMSIVLGIYIPIDFTLDVMIIFVFSTVLCVGMVFFLMMHIIGAIELSMIIYSVFIMLTVILVTMFHAQTIHGGRYAEMRLLDFLLAAIILYHDIIILLMALMVIVREIFYPRLVLKELDVPTKPEFEFDTPQLS